MSTGEEELADNGVSILKRITGIGKAGDVSVIEGVLMRDRALKL